MPQGLIHGLINQAKKRKDLSILDGLLEGQRCFVIGGGPSLNGFNFDCLDDDITIGVNRLIEFYAPTIFYSLDYRFYKWITTGELGHMAKTRFEYYTNLKVWLISIGVDTRPFTKKLHDQIINNPSIVGVPNRTSVSFEGGLANGIHGGNNSGYGALQLAVHMKANPIYLLGFDMTGSPVPQKKPYWKIARKPKMHFHDGYPCGDIKKALGDKGIGYFNRIAPVIVRTGIKVINLSPITKLECFEKSTIEEVL